MTDPDAPTGTPPGPAWFQRVADHSAQDAANAIGFVVSAYNARNRIRRRLLLRGFFCARVPHHAAPRLVPEVARTLAVH